MPGLICGRRNNGKFRLSDWSDLYCRHGGPVVVSGRGRYRGEALKSEQIPEKKSHFAEERH